MHINSIPNSRLHCCLIVLILFILIFLSLPLLLIYLANSNFELVAKSSGPVDYGHATHFIRPNKTSQLATSTTSTTATPTAPLTPTDTNTNTSPLMTTSSPVNGGEPLDTSNQPVVNCTEFAIRSNLSLIGDNFQCPKGTFPCGSCPDICIEQARQCNSVADCPDKSDETYCHDSTGAMASMFQTIFNAKKNKPINKQSYTTLAKPDSCGVEEFLFERCPCVTTDASVVICDGLNYTSIPNTLLSSVYKIRMSNNSIESLDGVLWPRALTTLVLVFNKLKHLGKTAFEGTPNLSKLYISYNEIVDIHDDAFSGLPALTVLQAECNQIRWFNANQLLRASPVLKKLYLGENQIQLPEETRFSSCCQRVRELLLDHNQITHIRAHWFSNMTSLVWLSLTYNRIAYIEEGSFNWNYELEELNLSFNRIQTINRLMFSYRLNIQKLYLSGNPLRSLPVDAFREINHLRSLNLQQVEFDYIDAATFSYLGQLEFIYFEKFVYCHYANHVRVCKPLTDGLSSVQDLLAFPILKYAVWIVASVCSLGNVFVFIWRSVSPHEDRTLSLFVRNLSLADLMMGIYLGAIGWQDWQFQHHFGRHAIEWMSSWKCTAIGFLAILSSELSVFILTIITVERYRSITSIRRHQEQAQKRRARLYVLFAWLFSFSIAIYPVLEWYYLNNMATNGLCLPLHIDQPFTRGWQYSAFVYLGINFAAVVVIIALYVHMYAMIINGRQLARPVCRIRNEEKREDAILAIRFFFIVITDCLCWIPIVVIKLMALANFQISSSICAWLVVFIIPINSALNPILYTLAAPTSLRAAVCRLFERLCDKLDGHLCPTSHHHHHLDHHRSAKFSSSAATTSSTAGGGGGGSNYSHSSASTNDSTGATAAAAAAAACLMSIQHQHNQQQQQRRRRTKTGSYSTSTCDTFETSIMSGGQHHKTSVESTGTSSSKPSSIATSSTTTTTTTNCRAAFVVDLQLADEAHQQQQVGAPTADSENDGDADDDDPLEHSSRRGAPSQQTHHTTGGRKHRTSHQRHNHPTMQTGGGAARAYECLSTYENNAIKLELIDDSSKPVASRRSLIDDRAAIGATGSAEDEHHNEDSSRRRRWWWSSSSLWWSSSLDQDQNQNQQKHSSRWDSFDPLQAGQADNKATLIHLEDDDDESEIDTTTKQVALFQQQHHLRPQEPSATIVSHKPNNRVSFDRTL